MHDLIPHWRDNAPFTGTSTRSGDVTNPATGEVTHQVAFASRADAEQVIASASAAAAGWAATSVAARTQVVFRFRELLNARREELAAIITCEHGKVLADAAGEVARGLEVVEFAVARLKQDLRDELAATGFLERVGEDRIFPTLPTAVTAYEVWRGVDE